MEMHIVEYYTNCLYFVFLFSEKNRCKKNIIFFLLNFFIIQVFIDKGNKQLFIIFTQKNIWFVPIILLRYHFLGEILTL